MGVVVVQAPARDERAGQIVREVDVHTAHGVQRVIVPADHASIDAIAAAAVEAGAPVAPPVDTAPVPHTIEPVASSPSGGDLADVLAAPVPEVRDRLAAVVDVAILDALEALEAGNKGRSGVLVAIARRREELRG